MILFRRQQRIINTSKYPQTHTSSLSKTIPRKALLAERFSCPYVDGLQLADSNFRAKKAPEDVPVFGHFTSRGSTRITAKFRIRLNLPTAIYYLNTTRSLDIKRRLRKISYHQAKGQIVISNTNTGGITRVYRDEKLLGFACLLHLGCALRDPRKIEIISWRTNKIIFAHSPKICFQLAHSFVMLLWDFACPNRLIPTS